MKPKKPQECWMPMDKRGYLWFRWARASRRGLLSDIGGTELLEDINLIPVKVQLIPVKTTKRGKR